MVQKQTFAKMTLLTLAAGAILLTGTLTMAASQDATPPMAAHHGMKKSCQFNKKMQKTRDAFLMETKEIRKDVAVKRAAMRAMMHSTNPDPVKVSSLAGEIFDLREQLRIKARAKGLPGLGFMGPQGMHPGCNMMKSHGSMMGGHHSEKP
jgi:zinc resistance-associated protein